MDNVWCLSTSVNEHIENSCRNENYIFNPFLHFVVQGRNMRLHLVYEIYYICITFHDLCCEAWV